MNDKVVNGIGRAAYNGNSIIEGYIQNGKLYYGRMIWKEGYYHVGYFNAAKKSHGMGKRVDLRGVV